MREFLDKKEQICSKILEFRNELFERILEAQNNKDLKLRFELYKLELTLERAIYITALDDAIKVFQLFVKSWGCCFYVSKCS
ncbi:MAG: hypothetical protein SPF98_05400 [Campylobacter sp.]|nr:hypothetical protein [Campylobacter sp.]